ncbi:MAG: hypothetical protein AB1749_08185 [Pseudomonadota bacterium]
MMRFEIRGALVALAAMIALPVGANAAAVTGIATGARNAAAEVTSPVLTVAKVVQKKVVVRRPVVVQKKTVVRRPVVVQKKTIVSAPTVVKKTVVVRRAPRVVVVRPWYTRPYYGTVFAGVALGTIIAVSAAGVVPYAPDDKLCWYWTNPYKTNGYWDYCD